MKIVASEWALDPNLFPQLLAADSVNDLNQVEALVEGPVRVLRMIMSIAAHGWDLEASLCLRSTNREGIENLPGGLLAMVVVELQLVLTMAIVHPAAVGDDRPLEIESRASPA